MKKLKQEEKLSSESNIQADQDKLNLLLLPALQIYGQIFGYIRNRFGYAFLLTLIK